MKIKMDDIPKIVENLQFIQSMDTTITECDVLDYAIKKAIDNRKEVVDVLNDLKTFILKDKGSNELDIIISRDTSIKYEELNRIYQDLRCIASVRYYNGETVKIEALGFSDKLERILNKFEKSGNVLNLINSLNCDLLLSLVNYNNSLKIEFDEKMKKLGINWVSYYEMGPKYLSTNVTSLRDDYYEIESRYVKRSIRQQAIIERSDRQINSKIQHGLLVDNPFMGVTFNSLPEEVQRWAKIGFMYDSLKQMKKNKSFQYGKTRRFMSLILEEKDIDNNIVKIKEAKLKKRIIKQDDVLEYIKKNLDVVFELDRRFILKNKKILKDYIVKSYRNERQKRELLDYIDSVCNQKQVGLKIF